MTAYITHIGICHGRPSWSPDDGEAIVHEMPVRLLNGDALDMLVEIESESVDAIVTDPPYGLSKQPDMMEVLTAWMNGEDYVHRGTGFMGKSWDSFVPGPSVWREALRVLKPGAHALVFAGARTQDLMGLSLRLAGFEIRDCLAWIYGSGFPKSHNVSKAIGKAARGFPYGGVDPVSPHHGRYRTTKTEGKRREGDNGQGYGAGGSHFLTDGDGSGLATGRAESESAEIATEEAQWQGWGTGLKPAYEPILLARKPLEGTVADNVVAYGTGALNIDGARIGYLCENDRSAATPQGKTTSKVSAAIGSEPDAGRSIPRVEFERPEQKGRWPANVVFDEAAGTMLDEQSGTSKDGVAGKHSGGVGGSQIFGNGVSTFSQTPSGFGGAGGASRFFYCAKASRSEREAGLAVPEGGGRANVHPTVKPLALMKWLVTLVAPPGATILDPYVGSGTTGMAAVGAGHAFVGIDKDDQYLKIARQRILHHVTQVGAGQLKLV